MRTSGATVRSFIRSQKGLGKQWFSTTSSSQLTHYYLLHEAHCLLGDIILCINSTNWAAESLCKHSRILGKHRAAIIVIYPRL